MNSIKYMQYKKYFLLIFIVTFFMIACNQPGSDDSNSLEVTVSPGGGTFNAPQLVTLTANQQSTIYYTMNGETPTSSSKIYTKPIGINSSTTLKFFAINSNNDSSSINEGRYIISWDIPPTTIFNMNTRISSTKIVVDSKNVIHVVWADESNGKGDVFYSNSTNWALRKNVSNTASWSQSPEIAIDSQDVVHVVWTDFNDHDIDNVFYTNSKNWDDHTNISKKNYYSYSPRIAVDSQDVVHVVWSDETEKYCVGIIYANSINWDSRINITPSYPYESYAPGIAVDSNNVVHVVWNKMTKNYDCGISYANSTNWNAQINITTNSNRHAGNDVYGPEIAVDSSNTVHVVWNEITENYDSGIPHANSTNWNAHSNIVDLATSFSGLQELVVDNYDVVHMVWLHGINDIYYANSTNWTDHMKLFNNEYYSNWPDLAVDLNNIIHVVWDSHADGGNVIFIKP